MRVGHPALLAAIGEFLALGSPPLEVTLDDFALGAGTAQRHARGVDMTLALCMCDSAAILVGERKLELVTATRDEAVRMGKRRARGSRR